MRYKILAWNVRGLNDGEKRSSVRAFCGAIRCDVICLSESKLSQFNLNSAKDLFRWRNSKWMALNATGSAGGICVGWNDDLLELEDSYVGSYSVCVSFCSKRDRFRWALCSVYGPSAGSRLDFFEELKEVGSKWNIPVVLCGDFNVTRFPSEKKGGRILTANMKRFSGLIQDLGLVDPPLEGAKYTWKRDGGSIMSRIDRFLFCRNIDTEFSAISQRALPWILSDHRPLMLELGRRGFIPRPFRFENKWLANPSFLVRAEKWWKNIKQDRGTDDSLWRSFLGLKCAITSWSQKEELAQRQVKDDHIKCLNDLDLIEENRPLSAQEIGIRMLKAKSLMDWINREEIGLRQRSRAVWLKEGDRNSKFFHGTLKARARTNLINFLKVEDVVHDREVDIKREVVKFYNHLFSETSESRPKLDGVTLNSLGPAQVAGLEMPFSAEEVELALKDCRGDKAPGADGFSLEFIKKGWDFLKEDLMRGIHRFHEDGFLEEEWNKTLICLIRKTPGAIELKHFRPICLVSSFYKILAKCLANRLGKVMPSLISENQMAFLKGRQIFDASLIANECLDTACRRNERSAFIKLDIEKAFDHVNWDFLFYLLRRMGFGDRWIAWIKSCVSSVSYSVLINSEPVGNFKGSRGLRQGDPLSPFLFVIVMEAFSAMMRFMEARGCLDGFRIGNSQGSVAVSHLLFADDTLCMMGDNKRNAVTLRRILTLFENCAGLKVNGDKSEIFITGIDHERSRMPERLGFRRGVLPSIYLGLPLGASARCKSIWNPILESMEKRLATWKSFFLSKGGRLTLVKSVLAATPTFMLSLFRIPSCVAKKIEGLMRNFLWGIKLTKGHHWIKWSSVKKPMGAGGLGVRDLSLFNKALLSKWCFRFSSDRGSLWNRLIRTKFGVSKSGWFTKKVSLTHGRSLWKGISMHWEGFAKDVSFKVGDGRSVSFWKDRWMGESPLCIAFPSLFLKARCKDASVFDMFNVREESFSPNVRFLSRLSPTERTLKQDLISSLGDVVPNQGRVDALSWQECKHFSVKLCYVSLVGNLQYDEPWKRMWSSVVPSKVSFFGWCAMHGGIMTERKLMRKGFHLASRCVMCKKEVESGDHLLLHCSFVSQLWSLVWSTSGMMWAMPSTVKEFWFMWCGNNGKSSRNRIWLSLPLVLWWTIWIERNARVFEGKVKPRRVILDSFLVSLAEANSMDRVGRVGETMEALEAMRNGFSV